jgi:hypothetical protein
MGFLKSDSGDPLRHDVWNFIFPSLLPIFLPSKWAYHPMPDLISHANSQWLM